MAYDLVSASGEAHYKSSHSNTHSHSERNRVVYTTILTSMYNDSIACTLLNVIRDLPSFGIVGHERINSTILGFCTVNVLNFNNSSYM